MAEVEHVVRSSGVRLMQNPAPQLRGGDGAARIAQHYKYSLSGAFDYFKDAPAVIIGEDTNPNPNPFSLFLSPFVLI
jgi:hypothetical protein